MTPPIFRQRHASASAKPCTHPPCGIGGRLGDGTLQCGFSSSSIRQSRTGLDRVGARWSLSGAAHGRQIAESPPCSVLSKTRVAHHLRFVRQTLEPTVVRGANSERQQLPWARLLPAVADAGRSRGDHRVSGGGLRPLHRGCLHRHLHAALLRQVACSDHMLRMAPCEAAQVAARYRSVPSQAS
jgi:hypothetical protein